MPPDGSKTESATRASKKAPRGQQDVLHLGSARRRRRRMRRRRGGHPPTQGPPEFQWGRCLSARLHPPPQPVPPIPLPFPFHLHLLHSPLPATFFLKGSIGLLSALGQRPAGRFRLACQCSDIAPASLSRRIPRQCLPIASPDRAMVGSREERPQRRTSSAWPWKTRPGEG